MENKFNIGRKVLSDSEIARHKDFASLYRSYQTTQRPLYKTTRFITGISVAAAAIVIFVLYFSFFRSSTSDNIVNPAEKELLALDPQLLPRKVSPPLPGLDVPRQSFKIKGSKGGKIKTTSGTEISVPADAFVDQAGNTVEGEVEISYREFNNPVDFFLSGIPMHQVTEGQVYRTESAGMFEILAFQHDQSLRLNVNKNIGVDLMSCFSGDYNSFYYNAEKQQWLSLGENQLTAETNQVAMTGGTPKQKIDTTGLPVVPRKADKKKFVFNIKVDVSDFPELAAYKGLLFEVNETYRKFDERLYDNTWDRASLTESSLPGNYDLTLSIRDTSVTIMVYPVFNSRNYEEAMKVYQEKKLTWLAQQKVKGEPVANGITTRENSQNQTMPALHETGILDFNTLKPLGKRHFDVTSLGIYHCGKQLDNSNLKTIRPVIKSSEGKEIRNVVMYLAERNHNSLACFGTSEVISYRSGDPNLFWAVTPEGRIGLLKPESFAALTDGNATPVFRLSFMDTSNGLAALREALKI